MKNMKRFLTLFIALSLVLSVTAFAAPGDPSTIKEIQLVANNVEVDYADGDVNFGLTYSAATEGGMYLVLVLSEGDVPTNSNILYVNQATAGANGVTFDNVYPMEIVESSIHMAGTDMVYTKLGNIIPNVEVTNTDVTVNVIGEGPEYVVDGHNVTVSYDLACMMFYENASGGYDVLSATENADGGYDYVVPADVSEVTVVVKGDVNGNGTVNTADALLISRSLLLDTHRAYRALTEWEEFIADVNGNGTVNTADALLVSRSLLLPDHRAYQLLKW